MYTLKIPGNVIAGAGAVDQVVPLVQGFGAATPALFIDAGVLKSGAADRVVAAIKEAWPSAVVIDDVPPEPEEGQVRAIYDRLAPNGVDAVIAIGGGSVLDTAKMVAVMRTNPAYYGDLTEKEAIEWPGLPLVAVPTSAGTGSEATPNSIILLPERQLKVGVVHDSFLPGNVILDPELTRSLPPAVTASTGLDAFCHCIETLMSKKRTPFSSVFSREGLRLISKSLRKAYTDGDDMQAREDMLLAAFYGGVAISCSSTVGVHALSYPLGGTYRIPHGVSNAILLPHVVAYNIDAIADVLEDIAQAMGIETDGLDDEAVGEAVVVAVFCLVRDCGIPDSLTGYGVRRDDIDALAQAAYGVRRLLDQNPKDMSIDDIRSIYAQLL